MKRILAISVLFINLGFSLFSQESPAIKIDFNFVEQNGIKTDKYNTSDAAQFFDDSVAFKGKTIRLIVRLVSGGQLRNVVGTTAKFIGFTSAPMEYFFISIPKGLTVPNVSEYTDTIIITFRCEKGLLEEGNVALEIVRAKR